MLRRGRAVDVADLGDADLLERVLARSDLDSTERAAFDGMLGTILQRVEQYGDDAYPLTEPQRRWAEMVAVREKSRLTGEEFAEVVRATIGRDLRLRERERVTEDD